MKSRRAQIPGTKVEFPRAGKPGPIDKARLLLAARKLWRAINTMKKSSWKTTLGGLLTAAGQALAASTEPVLRTLGQVLSIIGPILLGLAARDNNVSSEQAGVK